MFVVVLKILFVYKTFQNDQNRDLKTSNIPSIYIYTEEKTNLLNKI